jgi:hypothetical protein
MYIRNINQIQRLNRNNIPLNVFYKYNFTAKNVKIHFLRNICAKFHCNTINMVNSKGYNKKKGDVCINTSFHIYE